MEEALTVRTSVMGIADEGPIKGEAGDPVRLHKSAHDKKEHLYARPLC